MRKNDHSHWYVLVASLVIAVAMINPLSRSFRGEVDFEPDLVSEEITFIEPDVEPSPSPAPPSTPPAAWSMMFLDPSLPALHTVCRAGVAGATCIAAGICTGATCREQIDAKWCDDVFFSGTIEGSPGTYVWGCVRDLVTPTEPWMHSPTWSTGYHLIESFGSWIGGLFD